MKPRFRAVALLCLGLSVILQVRAEDYKIAVIPKGTTHEFWKSINAGAVKASQEFAAKGVNVEIIWKGPLREDDRDQQIQVVENFIPRRVIKFSTTWICWSRSS